MRVLVAGAGAVGSWLGGALAAGGHDVVLTARGAHGAAVLADGLALQTPSRVTRVRVGVAPTVAEAGADRPYDAVLVAVKGYDTASLADELAEADLGARVICFQNGVGNEAVLGAVLDRRSVTAATLTTGVALVAPGTVRGSDKGGVGAAGPAQDRLVASLFDGLAAGGLSVRRYDHGPTLKWSKLLLNVLGSATSAALAWPPARVFSDQRLFALEGAAWREALAVVRAQGLRPVALPGYPVPLYAAALRALPSSVLFRLFGARLAAARGERLPSVAADLAAGSGRTENAMLSGAVAATGVAYGVPVPVTQALSDLVEALAAGRVSRTEYAGRPASLLAAVARGDREATSA